MKKILCICIIGYLAAFVNCGMGGVGRGLAVKNAGREKIVEKNGSRPDWAIEKPMFVKDGILYASGMFTDAPNLSMGLIAANKRAQANVVDSLKEHLQRTYREASEGMRIDQIDFQHMIFTSSEAIVGGFFVNKNYYEKKEVRTSTGIQYKYDCYALAEITGENYLKTLDGVLNGYQNRGVISEEFRKKVDAREEEFFQKDRVLNNLTGSLPVQAVQTNQEEVKK